MIEKVRIQNYKALRNVTLELTPIHVLIGPNDSGKTSILEAVAAALPECRPSVAAGVRWSLGGSESRLESGTASFCNACGEC